MKARFGAALVLALVLSLISADSYAQSSECTFSVSPTSVDLELRGDTVEINVTASAPACTFTAKSAYPWITVSATQEQGKGVVRVSIEGNTSMTHRIGVVAIDGYRITVTQFGPRIGGGGY